MRVLGDFFDFGFSLFAHIRHVAKYMRRHIFNGMFIGLKRMTSNDAIERASRGCDTSDIHTYRTHRID